MFRNERTLYKRKCDLCSKDMVTVIAPEKPLIVYCSACWWSDKWDDGSFYLDYDPKRNFFEQLLELQKKTPHMGLIVDHPTLVNSDYVNHAGDLKNCYLVFNSNTDENTHYSVLVTNVKDSMDCMMVGESELCYEDICAGGFNLFFSDDCGQCQDVYFSKACEGCTNCFGCINLRNKKYHIFNEPYSKEEYEKKIKEFKLDTYSGLTKAKKQAEEFWLKHPHRYMHGDTKSLNVSGDYVYAAKNALNCYQTRQIEDARYCQFISSSPARDIYDLSEWGEGAEMVVDSVTVGQGVSNVKFSSCVNHAGTINVEYSMYAISCKNSFGCLNIKKKEYRILNKQYSPEEYQKLKAQIVQDMNDRPYIDSVGRGWKYGDFFPYDLSPYAYNESHAIQYFPISKEEAATKGWRWREPTPSNHKITLLADAIPDSIKDIDDSILKEILGCVSCQKPFRIIPAELQLLKRWEFPIPRKCPACRHDDRMARINPNKLWDRKCDKCQKPIQTAYAPNRPEIVYCETCYQQEVA